MEKTLRRISFASLLLVLVLLTGDAASPGGPPTQPHVGETWTRARDGMVLVYVPSGEFEMGTTDAGVCYARELCLRVCGALSAGVCLAQGFSDEQPAHRVAVTGLWLDRTEVTNAQYARCVAAGACTLPPQSGSFTRATYHTGPAFANHLVVWVTWSQAVEYAAWVGARLPTEAEWEYAARGTRSLVFPWGDAFDGTRLSFCARECAAGPKDASVADGYPDTAPVGTHLGGASWCGALDLAGHVREWVLDWDGPYAGERQSDPRGPSAGEGHIAKGGSCLDRPDDVRSANRGLNAPGYAEY